MNNIFGVIMHAMERLGPDFLRTCADALENPNRLGNVERVVRCPELDQEMLLALNGAKGDRTGYQDNLDAGTVANWLRERIIEVTTPDSQGTVLGFFYTNIEPLKRRPHVAIGVFPLYSLEIDYVLRPHDFIYRHTGQTSGTIEFQYESATENDPLLVRNRQRPSLLFYKTSPFQPGSQYQRDLPRSIEDTYLPYQEPCCDLALENNLIRYTLNELQTHRRRPILFRQSGFPTFINSHCSDPRYLELHAAYTQLHRKK